MTISSHHLAPCLPGTNIPAIAFIDAFVKGFNLKAITRVYPNTRTPAIQAAINKVGQLYIDHLRANDLTTIVPALQAGLKQLDGVEVAFIFGSTARGEATPASDIDLMLIGDAGEAFTVFGWQFLVDHGRIVDVMTYTENEWRDGVAREGGFERHVLQQPIVMLKGEL